MVFADHNSLSSEILDELLHPSSL